MTMNFNVSFKRSGLKLEYFFIIPAAGYSSMKQFFDQILSDEKQKIVIRKDL